MRKTANKGSVIHGTMREEDLIPAFLIELEELDPEKAEILIFEADKLDLVELPGYSQPYYTKKSKDNAIWLLETLFDVLDQCAPEGYFFGSHPGDGSDYGFWKYEEE